MCVNFVTCLECLLVTFKLSVPDLIAQLICGFTRIVSVHYFYELLFPWTVLRRLHAWLFESVVKSHDLLLGWWVTHMWCANYDTFICKSGCGRERALITQHCNYSEAACVGHWQILSDWCGCLEFKCRLATCHSSRRRLQKPVGSILFLLVCLTPVSSAVKK